MEIKTTSLSYNFDDNGVTASVQTSLSGNDGKGSYINANLRILDEELEDGKTFDDMTRKKLDTLFRQKLANMTKVQEEEKA